MNMHVVIGTLEFLTDDLQFQTSSARFQHLVVKKIFTHTHNDLRIKKAKCLFLFDQKTKPYTLDGFRDVKKSNTLECCHIFNTH